MSRHRPSIGERLCLTVATVAMFMLGAVAVSGALGFIGLLVPHSVRLLWGHDSRWVVWLSLLWGAAFLIACDIVVRWVFAPVEIPVGVLTALIGAPAFLFILLRASDRPAVPL